MRLPWIALAIIAIVAIGVVFAYFGAEKAEEAQKEEQVARREALKPESGTACDPLLTASRAFESGDTDQLKASIEEAEELAVKALNTTGIKFGKPEEMALYLGSEELGASKSQARIEERLGIASEFCTRLDS
jgi:hypothetical protein